MKDIITIIKYTIKENITKKSFIIATVILIALIVLICNVPNIVNLLSDNSESEKIEKVLIDDGSNLLGEDLYAIKDMATAIGYEVEINMQYTEEQIKEKIVNEEILGYIQITLNEETGMPKLNYTTNGSMFSENGEIEQFASLIKVIQLNKELVESNVSFESIEKINSNIEYEIKYLNDENNNFGVAMASAFILFFAIYFYGNTVAVSVSSEKTSRVMETLITSTSPTNIIIGKTVAMGIVGLMQMLILILTAVASYKLFIPEDMEFISAIIGNINFSIGSIAICIIYFILGYTTYAFLNAVTGATVSKVEDLQSAQTPVALISLFSFYLAYFTATMPDSPASRFASIFPLSSAFSMPGRILAGGATTLEIVASILIILLTATIFAIVSIKVYSGAVLHYGKRLKLNELFKLKK